MVLQAVSERLARRGLRAADTVGQGAVQAHGADDAFCAGQLQAGIIAQSSLAQRVDELVDVAHAKQRSEGDERAFAFAELAGLRVFVDHVGQPDLLELGFRVGQIADFHLVLVAEGNEAGHDVESGASAVGPLRFESAVVGFFERRAEFGTNAEHLRQQRGKAEFAIFVARSVPADGCLDPLEVIGLVAEHAGESTQRTTLVGACFRVAGFADAFHVPFGQVVDEIEFGVCRDVFGVQIAAEFFHLRDKGQTGARKSELAHGL